MQNLIPLLLAMIVNSAPAAEPRSVTLQKSFDGLRKSLPEPGTLTEMNGFTIKDAHGKDYVMNHLAAVARRLNAKSQADCLVMLTYLKDPDLKMRFMAATAIENVVHAYPGGMSLADIQRTDSKGHREMIRRFIERIAKLKK